MKFLITTPWQSAMTTQLTWSHCHWLKPSEFSAFGTIVRLSLTQNQTDQLTNTYAQTISNRPIIPQSDITNTPKTNTTQTYNQSNIILLYNAISL